MKLWNKVHADVQDTFDYINDINVMSQGDKMSLFKDITDFALSRSGLEEHSNNLSISEIADITTDVTGVTMHDINSKRRLREVIDAITIIVNLARKYTTLTTVKIGQFIGNRDHSSVVHHCKKLDNLLMYDKEFKRKYNTAEQILRQHKL